MSHAQLAKWAPWPAMEGSQLQVADGAGDGGVGGVETRPFLSAQLDSLEWEHWPYWERGT